MISDVKARVDQLAPTVLSEGSMDYPAMSKIGQLFTVDWVVNLILAGCVYRMSWGTISGSTANAGVTVGTVIDLDMPMGIVAIDSGFLIPISLQTSIVCDTDASEDTVEVLLTGDRTGAAEVAAYIATFSGTAETPDNLLDGGPSFQGRAVSVGTTALDVIPTSQDLLFYRVWEAVGASALGPTDFFVDKEFPYPTFIAGPSALLVYVAGSSGATAASMGSLVFAHIPAAYVPTS